MGEMEANARALAELPELVELRRRAPKLIGMIELGCGAKVFPG
jgi:hypothetical protein